MVTDDAAHARMENFRPSAGARVHTSFFHAAKRFFDGAFRNARKIMNFDHREGFKVNTGAALLESANHFQKIIEWQVGMQSANDVKFGCAFAHDLLGGLI